jgi:precorrin-6A/cobalt-precorrin-6A reductase
VDDELVLMREHEVDVVVTKDSGGGMTAAKLVAARRLGIPVVLVRRPPVPPGVPVVATVEDARAWVLAR